MSQTYISAALRKLVRERAGDRCEYCLIPESVTFASHWIDHIVAEKHGGKTEAENLANSCVVCNERKGSDLSSIDPETGAVVPLFHPRRDRWSEHFRLAGGRIESITPNGRVTERLLQFNIPDRVEEREQLIEAGLLTASTV
jgi:5-methylcytosine-specific restriction endonuclease McrA